MTPLELEQSMLARQKPMEEAIARGDSAILNFYKGSKIFLTGGTGFIGKLIIEKILRSCSVSIIYVLIRKKKNLQPKERLVEIFKDPVFNNLHKIQPDFVNKVIALEGDVGELNIGMSDDDWSTISEEVDVIFHVAANIKFDVGLKEAVLCNARGTREALRLGRACKKLRAFVHVSTAYTHATRNRDGCVVPEQFQESPAPPEAIIKFAEVLDTEKLNGVSQCLMDNWANTYCMSKAIADEIVRTMPGDMPVCIVKPAVVISTYCEPTPGWLDSSCVHGPSGFTLGIGLGIMRTLFMDERKILDLVPADLVTNAIIASAWDTAKKREVTKDQEPKIYTVTSVRNPTIWGYICDTIRYSGPHYASPQFLWYPFSIETKNYLFFLLLTWVLHYIPAYIIEGFCLIAGKPRRILKLYGKVFKMNILFSFFSRREWLFSDDNTRQLYREMSEPDRIIFDFNIETVNKKEMIFVWILGLRKYILKDDLKYSEYTKKKMFWLGILHYMTLAVYIFFWWKLLMFVIWSMTTVISYFGNNAVMVD